MYLVPADHYHRGRSSLNKHRRKKQHPYEEWVKIRHKFREADIRRKTRTNAIYNFPRRVMPDRELPTPTEPELPKQLIVPKVEVKTPSPPSFVI